MGYTAEQNRYDVYLLVEEIKIKQIMTIIEKQSQALLSPTKEWNFITEYI